MCGKWINTGCNFEADIREDDHSREIRYLWIRKRLKSERSRWSYEAPPAAFRDGLRGPLRGSLVQDSWKTAPRSGPRTPARRKLLGKYRNHSRGRNISKNVLLETLLRLRLIMFRVLNNANIENVNFERLLINYRGFEIWNCFELMVHERYNSIFEEF